MSAESKRPSPATCSVCGEVGMVQQDDGTWIAATGQARWNGTEWVNRWSLTCPDGRPHQPSEKGTSHD